MSDEIGTEQPSARGVAVHGDTDQEPCTIQLVPTLLNDGIRLGDTDRKIRMVQLERHHSASDNARQRWPNI